MAKYLGQLLPGFCQVSTLPRNWGYSIVKYEKKTLLATAAWSKSGRCFHNFFFIKKSVLVLS